MGTSVCEMGEDGAEVCGSGIFSGLAEVTLTLTLDGEVEAVVETLICFAAGVVEGVVVSGNGYAGWERSCLHAVAEVNVRVGDDVLSLGRKSLFHLAGVMCRGNL